MREYKEEKKDWS